MEEEVPPAVLRIIDIHKSFNDKDDEKPSIPVLFYEKRLYAVIRDSTSIVYSYRPDNSVIYAVVRSKTHIYDGFYHAEDTSQNEVVSCMKPLKKVSTLKKSEGYFGFLIEQLSKK